MSKIIEPYRGYTVVYIDESCDTKGLRQLQDKTEKNKLIYVNLEGVEDKYLHPDRFIVKNYESSLINHLLWDGAFTLEEQEKRTYEMIDKFIDTGKQTLIENYDYVVDEPFYDYSGGPEE